MTHALCRALAERLRDASHRFDALHATLGAPLAAQPGHAATADAHPDDGMAVPRSGILGVFQTLLGIVRRS